MCRFRLPLEREMRGCAKGLTYVKQKIEPPYLVVGPDLRHNLQDLPLKQPRRETRRFPAPNTTLRASWERLAVVGCSEATSTRQHLFSGNVGGSTPPACETPASLRKPGLLTGAVGRRSERGGARTKAEPLGLTPPLRSSAVASRWFFVPCQKSRTGGLLPRPLSYPERGLTVLTLRSGNIGIKGYPPYP